jgi:hypothetical protein
VALGGTSLTFDAAGARGTAFGKTDVVAGQAIVSGDVRPPASAGPGPRTSEGVRYAEPLLPKIDSTCPSGSRKSAAY